MVGPPPEYGVDVDGDGDGWFADELVGNNAGCAVTARSRPTRTRSRSRVARRVLGERFHLHQWCDGNGSGQITLANGQSTVCTINNDDIAPSLELDKTVTNDNGGTAPNTAWTLTATGDGWFADELVGDDAGGEWRATFKADTYTLSETGGPAGYTASVFVCTNGVTVTAGQITLANGQSTVCTINERRPGSELDVGQDGHQRQWR